jgi:hypothetical protein
MSQQDINNTEARIDAEDRENEYLERHEKMIQAEVDRRMDEFFADPDCAWEVFVESLYPDEDFSYPLTPDDELGVGEVADYVAVGRKREIYDNERKKLILHHLKAHDDREVGFLIRSLFYNERYVSARRASIEEAQRKMVVAAMLGDEE